MGAHGDPETQGAPPRRITRILEGVQGEMSVITIYTNGEDRPVIIPGDSLEHYGDEWLLIWSGDALVGMFRMSEVIKAYRSEKKIDATPRG